ncbi:MAG: GTPase HflX [Bdellovibrionales bacterium]|nr:GTPase HflX [Bdellovibrionales bacterium]
MKLNTILISAIKNGKQRELKENLEELRELALAVDLHPIDKLKQNLRQIDSAFLIGSGKRKELEQKVKTFKAHYVIFDHPLTGVQTRNLEKLLKVSVLDRTQLILKIFARRARSHEGKLQVELAQLMDQMPRMTGAWLGSLSRQGGGRFVKGPGEKALETDRRQIQNRIQKIKEKLEKVKKNRIQHRQTRLKKKIPSFALIGYTNSGKSTLLNRLTKSNVAVKDQAFMTLDPKTRKLFIPGTTNPSVITDTVGFIRKLPTHLISAFKATLEESASADIILHVVDSAHPKRNQHIKVVDALIEEFQWNEKPILYVFNKMDLLSREKLFLHKECENRIPISARTGWNIPVLLEKLKKMIQQFDKNMELFFPKAQEHQIYELSRFSQILKKETHNKGTYCEIKIPSDKTQMWKKYLIKK